MQRRRGRGQRATRPAHAAAALSARNAVMRRESAQRAPAPPARPRAPTPGYERLRHRSAAPGVLTARWCGHISATAGTPPRRVRPSQVSGAAHEARCAPPAARAGALAAVTSRHQLGAVRCSPPHSRDATAALGIRRDPSAVREVRRPPKELRAVRQTRHVRSRGWCCLSDGRACSSSMEAAAEPRGALSVEDADVTAAAFPTPAAHAPAGASVWAHTCARVGAPRRALSHLTNGASESNALARGGGVAKVRWSAPHQALGSAPTPRVTRPATRSTHGWQTLMAATSTTPATSKITLHVAAG